MTSPHLPRALAAIRASAAEQLIALSHLRKQSAGIREAVKTARAELDKQMAAELETLKSADAAIAKIEAEVKDAALQHYLSDPDKSKKPMPGVGIRIVRAVHYDEKQAKEWAARKEMFLTPAALDKKALDTFLVDYTGSPDTLGLQFAVVQVPSASVGADLDKLIDELLATTAAAPADEPLEGPFALEPGMQS